MALRHRKRGRHKYMGSRSWGAGNIKKRRGKGNKGGAGFGGGHKNKWTFMVRYYPDHFGKKARRTRFPVSKRIDFDFINVGEIEEKIERNILKMQGDKFAFAFEGKVLGGGKISHPVIVRAECFTKGAEEKIKAAGGQAIARIAAHAEEKAQKEKTQKAA